jgi:hypothetical protein
LIVVSVAFLMVVSVAFLMVVSDPFATVVSAAAFGANAHFNLAPDFLHTNAEPLAVFALVPDFVQVAPTFAVLVDAAVAGNADTVAMTTSGDMRMRAIRLFMM